MNRLRRYFEQLSFNDLMDAFVEAVKWRCLDVRVGQMQRRINTIHAILHERDQERRRLLTANAELRDHVRELQGKRSGWRELMRAVEHEHGRQA